MIPTANLHPQRRRLNQPVSAACAESQKENPLSAEMVLRRLKPHQLLPAVIFTCGFLSAFFVNDIVCLVMVPFVLSITRKMNLQPLPYLLAVATASNIGSVATITGNPQNMLIGSFSGIHYRV